MIYGLPVGDDWLDVEDGEAVGPLGVIQLFCEPLVLLGARVDEGCAVGSVAPIIQYNWKDPFTPNVEAPAV
jgi:hypothetical protein